MPRYGEVEQAMAPAACYGPLCAHGKGAGLSLPGRVQAFRDRCERKAAAARRSGRRSRRGAGRLIAVDVLKIVPISGVTAFQADFRDKSLIGALKDERVDAVLSDLSPNLS